MDVKRKNNLIKLLEAEVSKKQEKVKVAKDTSRDYAEITMGSWSANGDRANADRITDLAHELLEQVEKLETEIKTSGDITPENIIAPCFVVLRITGPVEKVNEFYFVNTNVKLPDIQILTPKTPLGQAISGKKVGEEISCQIEETNFSGIIEKIE